MDFLQKMAKIRKLWERLATKITKKTYLRKFIWNLKIKMFYLALFAIGLPILTQNGKIRKNELLPKTLLVAPRNKAYGE